MTLSSFPHLLHTILTTTLFDVKGQRITLVDVAVLAAFIVAALIVSKLLRRSAHAAMERRGFDDPGTRALTARLIHWIVLAVGIGLAVETLGIHLGPLLTTTLFDVQSQHITLVDLAIFATFIIATLIVSKLLRRSARVALERRGFDDPGTRALTERLIHWAVLAVGIGMAVENLGIQLAPIFAAGAVLAVGIGLAFQSVAQNFISGMILLIERSIKPGDILEVDGIVVRVEHMGIRATVGRTRDDEQLIIPNTQLAQGTVKNYTMQDSFYRVTVPVGVAYESDMRKARAALEEAASSVPWKAEGKEPQVYMTDFGNSSVNFSVSVWTDDPWRARRASSDLHEAVWNALADAGITIAFPQVDVHFDPAVDETLTRLPRAS